MNETIKTAFHKALKTAYGMRHQSAFEEFGYSSDDIYKVVFEHGYQAGIKSSEALKNDAINTDEIEAARQKYIKECWNAGLPARHSYTTFEAGYKAANESSETLKAEIERLKELLQGWQDWFNGPFAQGVTYINPPLKRTAEAIQPQEGK